MQKEAEEQKGQKEEDMFEEEKLSKEDLELIELYGPKIRKLNWYFENDKMVKKMDAK